MRVEQPATDVLTSVDFTYRDGFATYSHYNYLRPGPIAWLKRRRFSVALKLAEPYITRACGVIDYGCADGFFLPMLAPRCAVVTGVDVDENMLHVARQVAAGIPNARIVSARDRSMSDIYRDIHYTTDHAQCVLFLLETLEHVGTAEAMTESRIAFLRDLFSLLVPSGRIVVSVPKMVGPAFLAKHLVQSALRLPHEDIAWSDALRAGILRDTERIEPTWFGGHRGFNHEKLERAMRQTFRVKAHHSLTSAFYVLQA